MCLQGAHPQMLHVQHVSRLRGRPGACTQHCAALPPPAHASTMPASHPLLTPNLVVAAAVAATAVVSMQSVALCLDAPAAQESAKGLPVATEGLRARLADLVRLAEETGAALVPVVAVGEQTASKSLVEALLMPAQRIPTKVGPQCVKY
jgi:hypothetical protein